MTASPAIRHALSLRALLLSDQMLFSLAGFLLTLTLARHYPAADLAAYGIGLSLALILAGLQTQAYLIRFTLMNARTVRRRLALWGGEHLTLSFAGAALLSFLVLWDGVTALAALASYALYTQSAFARAVWIKQGQAGTAAGAALLYVLLIGSFAAACERGILPSFPFVLIAILLAGSAFGAAALLPAHSLPGWRLGAIRAGRTARRQGGHAFAGTLGAAGIVHAPLLVLGIAAPPVQTAAYVALRGLTQPLQIAARGLDLADKHKLSQTGRTGGRYRLLRRQLALYALAGAAAFGALLFFGDALIALVYPGRFAGFADVLALLTLCMAGAALLYPLESALSQAGRLPRFNRFRVVAGSIALLTALALCPVYGAWGAAFASAGGWALCLLAGLWLARPALCHGDRCQGESRKDNTTRLSV